MKYGILWVDPALLNNKIFDKDDPVINRDDCLYHYWLLKEKFKEYDINLVTQDQCRVEHAEFVLMNDMPKDWQPINCKALYLLLWECEMINPWSWWLMPWFKYFKKIFSWYPFEGERYVKTYWPQRMNVPVYKGEKSKLVCIINGMTKQSPYYKELYTARQKAISAFGDKIDVFGHGYKPVLNKYDVMKDYKFAICFENARDIDGYVTEKIFDAYKAGCVPIYWGNDTDNKINEFTTHSPYIDFGKYKDNSLQTKWQQLVEELTTMGDAKYNDLREAGSRAIRNVSVYSAENWANTVVSHIVGKN